MKRSDLNPRLEPPAPRALRRPIRYHALVPLALLSPLLSTLLAECGDTGTDGPTADELLAVTSSCAPLAGVSKFASDSGGASSIALCGLDGAIWFRADLDIDCDGGTEAHCKSDPYYQPETSCVDSSGDALDASNLPFIVLPLDSNGFAISSYGIKCGTVAAVIYDGQVEYGVLGDRGPKGVVGEASYAMAERLGIDPDPISGGIGSGVTYIVFTDNATASPIDSHDAAVTKGIAEAEQLLLDN